MSIIILMIPATLFISIVFLIAFIWSTKSGQLDDLETPAHRMLVDRKEDLEEDES